MGDGFRNKRIAYLVTTMRVPEYDEDWGKQWEVSKC
jgi:hypothetical protein